MKTEQTTTSKGTMVEETVRCKVSFIHVFLCDSYHPGRNHSFNKMCHTDVVRRESAGRMVGRRNKEFLSVKV